MRELLQHIDFALLQHATQLTAENDWVRGLTYFCAQVLIFVFPLVLLWLWDKPELASRHHGARKAVMLAIVTIVTALAAKSVINLGLVRSRPFISHPGLLHMTFQVDPGSFPSGHSLVAFAIAMSILLSGYKRLGWTLMVCALFVALGRVFAGVHYPSDVLGGSILGMAAAWYLHREASSLKRYLPNH